MCSEIGHVRQYGCTSLCTENAMTRPYRQKRRAEQQAETRARIVEAAVDLHTTIGPARTTLSMLAERAGVQRHTLYAHFPDERSLFMACSGLAMERDPLPDAAAWAAVEDRRDRLRLGLRALYDWYARNADLTACVLRDAEYHQMTREIAELRMGSAIAAYYDVLGEELSQKQQVVLQLALSYFTWRTLAREGGLDQAMAVDTMVRAINCEKEV